jgi:Family of unknown function (DUF5684)
MNGVVIVIYLAILVFLIAANWRVFTKAGEAGWKSIIPIWNVIVVLRIIGRPWWWIFLFLIPLVGIVIAVIMCIDLAKSFGKGGGFAVGLILLGIIFVPILGFGSATYRGPATGMAS